MLVLATQCQSQRNKVRMPNSPKVMHRVQPCLPTKKDPIPNKKPSSAQAYVLYKAQNPNPISSHHFLQQTQQRKGAFSNHNLCSQRRADTKNTHTQERKSKAQPTSVRQAHSLREDMTPDTSHDASSDSEHNAVDDLAGSAVAATGEVEPEGGDAGPDGLRAAAEKEGPDDGLGAGVEG